jgi:glycerophosphoryl diester phosphodiesterase
VRIVAGTAAASAVAASVMFASAPEASAKRKSIEIIAHRGGEDVGPEHTLKTLRKAIKLGADAVEVDVRFTRDDVPILMHDTTLDRTTDCDGRVREYKLRELRDCEVDGEKIPTLHEALRLFSKEHVRVYVHVKRSKKSHYRTVVKELNHFGLNDGRTAVTMADTTAMLRELKKAGSKRLGLVFNTKKGWKYHYDVMIAYNTPLDPDKVARAQRRGQVVLAVQDHGMSLRKVSKGHSNIDGLIVNRVKDALKKFDR